MTTLAEARTELITAIAGAGYAATDTPGAIDTPYVVVLGGGIDMARIVRGRVDASFRVVCVAGQADATASVADLDALKLGMITLLRGLTGWRLGPVREDGIRRFAGVDLLTADVIASRPIDI